MIFRSPAPSNVPVSGASSSSTAARSAADRQAVSLHEQGGAPFVELPGLQRRQGAGHLRHQGLRQAQEPAALGGGFAPGQGDLRPDPGPELPAAGIPASACSRRWARSKATASRACRAASADFRSSSWRVSSSSAAGLSAAGRPARTGSVRTVTPVAAPSGPLIAVHGTAARIRPQAQFPLCADVGLRVDALCLGPASDRDYRQVANAAASSNWTSHAGLPASTLKERRAAMLARPSGGTFGYSRQDPASQGFRGACTGKGQDTTANFDRGSPAVRTIPCMT